MTSVAAAARAWGVATLFHGSDLTQITFRCGRCKGSGLIQIMAKLRGEIVKTVRECPEARRCPSITY